MDLLKVRIGLFTLVCKEYYWYDFSFGCMLPVANGYGLSYKLKNKKNVALAYVGDGATSEGDFHEALNLLQFGIFL